MILGDLDTSNIIAGRYPRATKPTGFQPCTAGAIAHFAAQRADKSDS